VEARAQRHGAAHHDRREDQDDERGRDGDGEEGQQGRARQHQHADEDHRHALAHDLGRGDKPEPQAGRQRHRQRPEWDDDVCRLALDAMHRDLPMADRAPMWEEFKAHAPANFQFDAPFANAVAVSVDAPLIDQLVGWTGRQP